MDEAARPGGRAAPRTPESLRRLRRQKCLQVKGESQTSNSPAMVSFGSRRSHLGAGKKIWLYKRGVLGYLRLDISDN